MLCQLFATTYFSNINNGLSIFLYEWRGARRQHILELHGLLGAEYVMYESHDHLER